MIFLTGRVQHRPVPFNQHLKDIVTILAYFSSNPALHVSGEFMTEFSCFILRRTYIELRSRLDHGARIWEDHPIRVIAQWYKDNPNPAFTPTLLLLKPVPHLKKGMVRRGLDPADPITYKITCDNVLRWALLLEDVFNSIDNRIPKLGPVNNVPPPPEAEDTRPLVITMSILNTLISTLVPILIIEPLGKYLHSSYLKKQQDNETMFGMFYSRIVFQVL